MYVHRYISKICAADITMKTLTSAPTEAIPRIHSKFKTNITNHNKIAAFKKTLSPDHHYLEFQIKEGHVQYRLRTRSIDVFFVTLVALSGLLFFMAGIVLALHGLFSTPLSYRLLSGGLLFSGAGLGLILFTHLLYKFLRWGAGLSNPEQLLRKYGIH